MVLLQQKTRLFDVAQWEGACHEKQERNLSRRGELLLFNGKVNGFTLLEDTGTTLDAARNPADLHGFVLLTRSI